MEPTFEYIMENLKQFNMCHTPNKEETSNNS